MGVPLPFHSHSDAYCVGRRSLIDFHLMLVLCLDLRDDVTSTFEKHDLVVDL